MLRCPWHWDRGALVLIPCLQGYEKRELRAVRGCSTTRRGYLRSGACLGEKGFSSLPFLQCPWPCHLIPSFWFPACKVKAFSYFTWMLAEKMQGNLKSPDDIIMRIRQMLLMWERKRFKGHHSYADTSEIRIWTFWVSKEALWVIDYILSYFVNIFPYINIKMYSHQNIVFLILRNITLFSSWLRGFAGIFN